VGNSNRLVAHIMACVQHTLRTLRCAYSTRCAHYGVRTAYIAHITACVQHTLRTLRCAYSTHCAHYGVRTAHIAHIMACVQHTLPTLRCAYSTHLGTVILNVRWSYSEGSFTKTKIYNVTSSGHQKIVNKYL
jgi:hypothetical protein